MYGTAVPTSTSAYGTGVVGNTSAAQSASANMSTLNSTSSSTTQSLLTAIIVLLVIYIAWAISYGHEKIRDAVEPKNMALNIHNFFGIFLTVLIAGILFKTLLAKSVAWGIPGATALATVVHYGL